MKKILLSTILFLFCYTYTNAQLTTHKMLNIGYVYQNQSFGEIGGRLLFLKNDDYIYRLGASAMIGSTNQKFVILPKLQGDFLINTEKNVDILHSYYLLAGTEITTKYIAPKIGLSVFGIIDLTGGYAFSIDKNGINGKKLNGLNINFTINLPLVALHDLTK